MAEKYQASGPLSLKIRSTPTKISTRKARPGRPAQRNHPRQTEAIFQGQPDV
jgi:hypothetical protein